MVIAIKINADVRNFKMRSVELIIKLITMNVN